MKKFGKITATVCALAIAGSAVAGLAACGDGKKKVDDTSDTLVYALGGDLTAEFSPLFASSAYDQNVVGLTALSLGAQDRNGDVFLKDGTTSETNGKTYTYNTVVKDVKITGDNSTTEYDITLRDNLKNSDGTAVTVDDFILGLYAVCDTSYTGSSTFSAQPLVGLSDYWTDGNGAALDAYMATIKSLCGTDDAGNAGKIAAAYSEGELEGSTDSQAYFAAGIIDAAEKAVFDEAFDVAIKSTYFQNMLWKSYTPEQIGGPSFKDKEMYEAWASYYGIDIKGLTKEAATAKVERVIGFDELINYYNDYVTIWQMAKTDELKEGATTEVKSISGVKRISDTNFTLSFKEARSTTMDIQVAGLSAVAPAYYVPSYDYSKENFGFTKGNMNSVINTSAKTSKPFGAGPYKLTNYDVASGVAYLEANEHYYLGAPNIKKIQVRKVTNAEMPNAIKTGTADIGEVNYSKTSVDEIKGINASGEVIGIKTTDFLGYGYIGINADLVKVGNDKASDQSKALRKAYATLFAAYRNLSIDSYYGDTASVIEYPISNTSWAAPLPTDNGYSVAYSKDATGKIVITNSQTNDAKATAALAAASTWFEAAGFTKGSDGKFTGVPAYEAYVGGDGKGDHPSFQVFSRAKDALATIGVTLSITDITDFNVLSNAVEGGTAPMWVMAWGAAVDPDMTQVYSSGGPSNYYKITDTNLDKKIADAKSITDRAERKALYKEAMEIVMDWGVEVPVYQRKEAIGYSAQRVDATTFPEDLTPFYGAMSEIHKLKLK